MEDAVDQTEDQFLQVLVIQVNPQDHLRLRFLPVRHL